MADVGLLYVGAVLFLNGLMLLGVISGRSAGILNFFVGGMQVIFPTIVLAQANGDPDVIFAAAGIYLFGFTYLYVGLIQWTGHGAEGLGWFSLFVATCAVVIAVAQFAIYDNWFFGVVWMLWAVLWSLFFILLGLKNDGIGRLTGWFTVFVSFITGTIPALLALTGTLSSDPMWAIVLAVVGVASFVAAVALRERPAAPPAAADTATADTVTADTVTARSEGAHDAPL